MMFSRNDKKAMMKKEKEEEELLRQAVEFLSNPEMQRISLVEKVKFLRRKGLAENQIHKAVLAVYPGFSVDQQLREVLGLPEDIGRNSNQRARFPVKFLLTSIASILGVWWFYRERRANSELSSEPEPIPQPINAEPERAKLSLQEFELLDADLDGIKRNLRERTEELRISLREVTRLRTLPPHTSKFPLASEISALRFQKAQLSPALASLLVIPGNSMSTN